MDAEIRVLQQALPDNIKLGWMDKQRREYDSSSQFFPFGQGDIALIAKFVETQKTKTPTEQKVQVQVLQQSTKTPVICTSKNQVCNLESGQSGKCVEEYKDEFSGSVGESVPTGNFLCQAAGRKSHTYTKTTRTYTTKKGQKRVVYTKNNKFYIKRKSPTTGKFRYALIKLTV